MPAKCDMMISPAAADVLVSEPGQAALSDSRSISFWCCCRPSIAWTSHLLLSSRKASTPCSPCISNVVCQNHCPWVLLSTSHPLQSLRSASTCHKHIFHMGSLALLIVVDFGPARAAVFATGIHSPLVNLSSIDLRGRAYPVSRNWCLAAPVSNCCPPTVDPSPALPSSV